MQWPLIKLDFSFLLSSVIRYYIHPAVIFLKDVPSSTHAKYTIKQHEEKYSYNEPRYRLTKNQDNSSLAQSVLDNLD